MKKYFPFKKSADDGAKKKEKRLSDGEARSAESGGASLRPVISPDIEYPVSSDKSASPLLSDDDEDFITTLLSSPEATPVILSDGVSGVSSERSPVSASIAETLPNVQEATVTPEDSRIAAASSGIDLANHQNAGNVSKGDRKQASNGIVASLRNALTIDRKKKRGEFASKSSRKAVSEGSSSVNEAHTIEKEENQFAAMFEKLRLSTKDVGKIFSRAPDYKLAVGKFTQILKDINNGVPTAYNDLVDLFDTSSETFAKAFESLPKSLQKLITQTVPSKLTPEVLRTIAAASPALAAEAEKGVALGLKELISNPGLVAGLLKSVVSILKTRFPLLMGGGMATGLGVTVVMMILWYCYKRGKEVRLENEAENAERATSSLTVSDSVPGGDVQKTEANPGSELTTP